MRRQWLAGLIREVHTASRQTYGSRRVHAELTLGMGVKVSERLVAVLMSDAKIAGLPGPAKVKRLHGVATAILFIASSIGSRRTSSGSRTSQNIRREKERSTAAR